MFLLPELYFTYLPAVTILLTIFLEFPISILVVGEALLFPLGGAPAAGEGGGGGNELLVGEQFYQLISTYRNLKSHGTFLSPPSPTFSEDEKVE